ncbi:hypothetical protein KR222_004765 [Zaprionus bogoriensis]|nr:hypothetical protein KR222_004765 [Zaprionus bogoriensis]
MSTARFARSGRVRICILMSMFTVLILMIVIYHMSQQQLDETRAFRLRCEQNQEGLNVQLQSLTDDKLAAEKKVELMRTDKQSLQEELEKQQESERFLQQKYDDQLNKYKLLDNKHAELEADFAKNKRQHLDDRNALLLQVQQLQHDKKQNDAADWKNKYETLLRESEHKAHALQAELNECKANCNSAPSAQKSHQQQLNKPSALLAAETTPTRRSSPAQLVHSIEKPRNEKSFNEQAQVSPGLYRIGQATNATIKKPRGDGDGVGGVEQPMEWQLQLQAARQNHSLILNSVENFQIVPEGPKALADDTDKQQQQEQPVLAAAAGVAGPVSPLSPPRKSSSSTPNVEVAPNASVAPKHRSSSSSSTGQPPLAIPPAKPSVEAGKKAERKLPENVAPIPDNFDGKGDLAPDVDTAAEELPKNENNNRYANVVNDLEANKNQGGGVLDSGAHEVKDALNEQNFNLPGANQNLFDGDLAAAHAVEADNKLLAGEAAAPGGGGAAAGGGGDEDEDVMLGDVAVKQPQHLLDGDNLNNEIVADQGKEFADAVHLEDGLDEDQDGN